MSTEAIGALEVSALATDDAVLFLWSTSAHLPEAIQVITAWGFNYKTNIVWVNDRLGLGYYVRNKHELLLIATRGDMPCPPASNRPSSVIFAPRREHSAKPDEAYQLIERMYPDSPKIELFARNARDGWAIWGNRVPKHDDDPQSHALSLPSRGGSGGWKNRHASHERIVQALKKRGAPFGNKRGLGNRGGGRTKVYSPRMTIVARKCCERGMTDIEVADMLGIGLATLYRWKLHHPAFARAFKLGKAAADDRVERSLYSRAVGYSYLAEKAVMTRHGQKTTRYRAHIPPDTAAAVWYLKNRRPDRWRDSFRHEHTASPYDAIDDPAELRALLIKQAQHLGLIAPPIIDITPKESSAPPRAEDPSEALQTPPGGKISSA